MDEMKACQLTRAKFQKKNNNKIKQATSPLKCQISNLILQNVTIKKILI